MHPFQNMRYIRGCNEAPELEQYVVTDTTTGSEGTFICFNERGASLTSDSWYVKRVSNAQNIAGGTFIKITWAYGPIASSSTPTVPSISVLRSLFNL